MSGGFGAGSTAADTSPADATGVLKHAPLGNEIRAAYNPGPQPFRPVQRTSVQPTAPAATDGESEAEYAARKAAWDAYYKNKADQQQKRWDVKIAARSADMMATAPGVVPGLQAAASDVPGGIAGMMPGQPGLPGQAGASQSRDFFKSAESNPATDYSPYTTTNPISPYELKAGDVLTAKLITQINSDSPGHITGIVSKPVTDYATGMHILIPQGARLFGTYDTSIGYGQTRLITAWTRIIYPPPCSQSLDLGAMAGSDQAGTAGFEDITNNHLGKVFLNALLVSVFGAGIQLSQPPGSALQQYNPIQTGAGAVGQQMAELGQEFARRGLNIPPTEEIRQGFDFTVMIAKDIAFAKPWQDGVCDQINVAAK